VIALALFACTGTDPAPDTGAAIDTAVGEGTLALSFAIHPDWHDAMDEPAVGTFYGSFWRGDEVTGVGPDDGAEDLGGIVVEGIDLTSGEPTDVLFVSEALPAIEVVVLGFLDSDENADPNDPDPDDKDPVTLPSDNDFDLVADTELQAEVYFAFLNP